MYYYYKFAYDSPSFHGPTPAFGKQSILVTAGSCFAPRF